MEQEPIRLCLPSVPAAGVVVEGGLVGWRGGAYYRISGYDSMDPFFISLMSDSDLWMYISSRGGLTAGRRNADQAIFPYETVDKLHVSHPHTGPKTVIRCHRDRAIYVWRPFADDGRRQWDLRRAIYKHVLGCEVWFEERNLSLGLTFRYGWRPSDRFGWVRTAEIVSDRGEQRAEILDGVQNILPPGIGKSLQETASCLADAYKSSECDVQTGLATFGLTSNIVDRAEASEALTATVAWKAGLPGAKAILDGACWERFILGGDVASKAEHKGRRGSYLLREAVNLAEGETLSWHIVLDTPVDQAGVVELSRMLKAGGESALGESALEESALTEDIEAGRRRLFGLLAAADAVQVTGDPNANAHQVSNVLFNIGRGGVLPNQYLIDRADFADFARTRNRAIAETHAAWIESLPAAPSMMRLNELAEATGDPDLTRLCSEYLPLVFSRRHGDPSRPWNRFSIEMKNPDGSIRYAFQGNWRDIFQNWEALCRSFPECLEPIIAKFVNASTADGFNPYRITREGVDWEKADPDDPWSSIGYWGDHQVVYLLKLLEASSAYHPGRLSGLLAQERFCYADVPYDIKPYEDIVRNPQATIVFNPERQKAVDKRVDAIGTDGRLVHAEGKVLHVNLAEKLLVPVLAKLSNLVPGGGIWMNTMRPEWNDANNALVGDGMSVVTACYLYRYLGFCSTLFADCGVEAFSISAAVARWMNAVGTVIASAGPGVTDRRGALDDRGAVHHRGALDDRERRRFLDSVGRAFAEYRSEVYSEGLVGRETVSRETIAGFLDAAAGIVASTIRANLRPDGLYHAYNLLHLGDGKAGISNLQLMLEGQVAVLDSGLLSPTDAIALLGALRASRLFREDQHSYMLYPVKRLPGFLEKNRVPDSVLGNAPSLAAMVETGDRSIILRDAGGQLRFASDLRNADLLRMRLKAGVPEAEVVIILKAYEEVFNHKAFTGRSGTMYGYEGIGCIYWHMVAKLLLAVQGAYDRAVAAGEPQEVRAQLRRHYFDIRAGLGFTKEPGVFGAFPLDPYSHTPGFAGARQPGMTGQVKEEILTRWGELGIGVHDGAMTFRSDLLPEGEFLERPETMNCVDTEGEARAVNLEPGTLAFTFCQVPIVYRLGEPEQITVEWRNGERDTVGGPTLPADIASEIFERTGRIRTIRVQFRKTT